MRGGAKEARRRLRPGKTTLNPDAEPRGYSASLGEADPRQEARGAYLRPATVRAEEQRPSGGQR